MSQLAEELRGVIKAHSYYKKDFQIISTLKILREHYCVVIYHIVLFCFQPQATCQKIEQFTFIKLYYV